MSASGPLRDIERRLFLKRAVTVAWATPVMMTLLTGSAAATHATCLHLNDVCGLNQSGTCNTTGFEPCCTDLSLTCALVGGTCICVQA